MKLSPRYPLVTLSAKRQRTLYLIQQELKSRKLFDILYLAGLEESCFQPNLDRLILQNLGLDDCTDETFRIYNNIIDKRAKKVEATKESILKQAMKVYEELRVEKKRLEKKRMGN